MAGIKPLLILTVAALHLAAVTRCVGAEGLQLVLCMLVRVAVGASGPAGQGRRATVPALLPEVDVRPAFVVFPAGAADAVFLRVFH